MKLSQTILTVCALVALPIGVVTAETTADNKATTEVASQTINLAVKGMG
ncbi:hypothetical protein OAI07_01905 [Akkermansiaceae bacterium]|nr:hypothetical protein [Akkermansiaceae bacterium]